ncbi:hypothetical protein ACNSPG_13820 [Brucella pituitosa]|uniref:hypothetical protein n=1 Tax=Brucella pituitosa TaxID=571256 RepID=UPI003C79123C
MLPPQTARIGEWFFAMLAGKFFADGVGAAATILANPLTIESEDVPVDPSGYDLLTFDALQLRN